MRATTFMFSIMNVQEPSMMQTFSYINKKGIKYFATGILPTLLTPSV